MTGTRLFSRFGFAVLICYGLALSHSGAMAADQNSTGRTQAQPATAQSTGQSVSAFAPSKPENKKNTKKPADGK